MILTTFCPPPLCSGLLPPSPSDAGQLLLTRMRASAVMAARRREQEAADDADAPDLAAETDARIEELFGLDDGGDEEEEDSADAASDVAAFIRDRLKGIGRGDEERGGEQGVGGEQHAATREDFANSINDFTQAFFARVRQKCRKTFFFPPSSRPDKRNMRQLSCLFCFPWAGAADLACWHPA